MVLFVANFDKQTDEDDLQALFSNYGTVFDVSMFRDRDTDEPLGYAFVEIPDVRSAERAIEHLNGRWWKGRKLKVSQRRPRPRDDDD
ncbi:MAG: RNA-binding protein [Candidatus Sulfotelmatobacter sp.]